MRVKKKLAECVGVLCISGKELQQRFTMVKRHVHIRIALDNGIWLELHKEKSLELGWSESPPRGVVEVTHRWSPRPKHVLSDVAPRKLRIPHFVDGLFGELDSLVKVVVEPGDNIVLHVCTLRPAFIEVSTNCRRQSLKVLVFCRRHGNFHALDYSCTVSTGSRHSGAIR